jgi:hypothetical protein
MADVYSFTTTTQDPYLTRVVEEAPDDKDFIVVAETLTTDADAGENRLYNLYLLIREAYLDMVADNYPNHVFLKHELGDVRMKGLVNQNQVPGYYTFTKLSVPKSELDSVEVSLSNEINRLKNLAEDRIIKVTVVNL